MTTTSICPKRNTDLENDAHPPSPVLPLPSLSPPFFYLTAGIEVLDVVQGTSDGGHDRETVDGLKEDWVFNEEIDADGEEGVEEEAQRQGQVGRPRRLTIFKQRVDEEARPEYHWKLI